MFKSKFRRYIYGLLFLLAFLFSSAALIFSGSQYSRLLPTRFALGIYNNLHKSSLQPLISEFIEESKKQDNPRAWADFRKMQMVSKDHKVRPNGLAIATQQRNSLIKKNPMVSSSQNSSLKMPSSGIASNQWINIGPGNIGGRVRSILFDPQNSNTLWIGSAGGGVWKNLSSRRREEPGGQGAVDGRRPLVAYRPSVRGHGVGPEAGRGTQRDGRPVELVRVGRSGRRG